jgi:hypothetical protein
MTENKANLLVQLCVGDLQQLIQEAVKNELEKITKVIQMTPKDSENESNIITREQTAKMLNVSLTTLYFWNKNKILEAKKINSRVYYLKDKVLEKLNAVA